MDSNNTPSNNSNNNNNAEAELESFRQKWREEVSARSKGKAPIAVATTASSASASSSSSKPHAPKSNAPDVSTHSHARHRSLELVDEVEPHTYHDLGEKQHGRRLDETSAQAAAAIAQSREPGSALEHYEQAVEKESQGSLGDSVNLYRKAFRLDPKVHEAYKAKHFPPSSFKPKPQQGPTPSSSKTRPPLPVPSTPADPNPSNAPVTVPNTAHHSLHGLSPALQSLLSDFSSLSIQGEDPPTDLSPAPPCPISTIPEEILTDILTYLAILDVASFVRLAQVCKRLAYLVATEDSIWKRIVLGHEYGFAAMHYSYACRIDGKPLGDDDEGGFILGTNNMNSGSSSDIEDQGEEQESQQEPPTPLSLTPLLVPTPYPTYRTLFHRRPRIRFNGCYISTVNYIRAGASAPTSTAWGSPVHIVTYYRYLRFLRNGTCISLLTTSEPSNVVPYLSLEHLHRNHGSLPSAPMKDAVIGRWRLTGPEVPSSSSDDDDSQTPTPPIIGEKEGTLLIETAGATPKYIYKMVLGLSSAGKGARNNKLNWQGYWSYNRLTDDWGEFGLKNDRAFFWSRVKSWGTGE